MEDAPTLLKISKSECPDIWIRLPMHKWPKSWSIFERNLCGHPLAGLSWERQFEKVVLKYGWEKFQIGNASSLTEKKTSVYVDDLKLAHKTETTEPTWKFLLTVVDFGEPTFLDLVYLGCKQRECKISNDMVASYRDMLEFRVSAGAKDNYRPAQQGNVMQKNIFLLL